ncbi:2-polyprenylphenol 6-hydroxylase [Parvibaculum sp.]|uniref:2-polyprenylphenol 6-hydroxylase n=1 Tax=Parvibaculum sp. TaxID=2024848 RepID=UPI002731A3EF|nr:2-polyprenylphenol 6-hydroxylase [Parvibaculum sp.]MDP1626095.1 2-polyprenylphenol 6-hydroxylase [Parvibaculum sp.]MDP2151412.1 2-polyprenylphenol 6-hydroxylase [Parvibaculum sp.]MDP3329258.1 2-polyprenylphenol 6-hydroxylase [Parvibaculum sp.]
MLRSFRSLVRLTRAARVLGKHDALVPLELRAEMPGILLALMPLAKIRLPWEPALEEKSEDAGERLATALAALGPAYIKLGQFLATRPDLIGPRLAADLSSLQDKLPPFPMAEARRIIEDGLGKPVDELFSALSEPIAAASIAQVHRARTQPEAAWPDGRDVAVKVLRPDVELRFAEDLESFFWVAERIERNYAPARRLRPIEVVQTLADSVKLEMDLRLEAAAMSEMAENTAKDPGFRVPVIDWERTSRRVLTMEWIDGIAASDREALVAAGHDMGRLGTLVIQSFLMHAMRDGFFHADMHQGNLFVDADGRLVAVDFGIMGRIGPSERRFLAEILYGIVTRDYTRVAEIHFEAGYVPSTKSIHAFAQALRAVAEPIFGRPARDVSMGKLLAQLFQVTEQFDMKTRPELLLLQKTMVVVEGVARHFDPDHNIWESAEPVLKSWMIERMAPETRIEEAAAGAMQLGRMMSNLPDVLDRAERTARLLAENVDEEGVRIHPSSADAIARARERQGYSRPLLWAAIGAVGALLLAKLF